MGQLGSPSFFLNFLNQFWVTAGLACSFYEAMARSLSVATTAVSSEKFSIVDSGELEMTTVYSRYNNGPRTLPWFTPALTGGNSVYSV
jgi:hypothetical protein